MGGAHMQGWCSGSKLAALQHLVWRGPLAERALVVEEHHFSLLRADQAHSPSLLLLFCVRRSLALAPVCEQGCCSCRDREKSRPCAPCRSLLGSISISGLVAGKERRRSGPLRSWRELMTESHKCPGCRGRGLASSAQHQCRRRTENALCGRGQPGAKNFRARVRREQTGRTQPNDPTPAQPSAMHSCVLGDRRRVAIVVDSPSIRT